MVVIGIMVAGTTIGMSYTGSYSKIGVPSEIAAEMGIAVQPETGEEPRTEGGFVQHLLSLPSSSNMHLPFSPS